MRSLRSLWSDARFPLPFSVFFGRYDMAKKMDSDQAKTVQRWIGDLSPLSSSSSFAAGSGQDGGEGKGASSTGATPPPSPAKPPLEVFEFKGIYSKEAPERLQAVMACRNMDSKAAQNVLSELATRP